MRSADLGALFCRFRRRLLGPDVAGKIYLDGRSHADLRVNLDVPARLADEPEDLAKPKSRAFTQSLGGEEGVEGLGDYVFRHATAGVAHRKHYILTRRDLMLQAIAVIDVRVSCLDRQI